MVQHLFIIYIFIYLYSAVYHTFITRIFYWPSYIWGHGRGVGRGGVGRRGGGRIETLVAVRDFANHPFEGLEKKMI